MPELNLAPCRSVPAVFRHLQGGNFIATKYHSSAVKLTARVDYCTFRSVPSQISIDCVDLRSVEGA